MRNYQFFLTVHDVEDNEEVAIIEATSLESLQEQFVKVENQIERYEKMIDEENAEADNFSEEADEDQRKNYEDSIKPDKI